MWILAFKKSILCFGLIFNFWTPSALCHGLCVCVHAWVCECVYAAVILPITLPLHHMFRIRQCWSLLWFLPTPLPLSPCKNCYSVDPPVSTSCCSLLEKGTNCSVLCSSSQAWKGKRWEKRTEWAFSHGQKGWVSWASSLFLPLPLFAAQVRSLSL